MSSRLKLQALFESLLGSRNVYFQPPASLKINYPAIVYGLDNIQTVHANDNVYLSHRVYSVTVIDEDPDSEIVGRVLLLPKCRFDRCFESENLNHNVFTINY